MPDYKKLVADALNRANKQPINESTRSLVYPEDINERMNPILEQDLINRTHSLGAHPIFPDGDQAFDEKLLLDCFSEVVKRYKKAHDVDNVDQMQLMMDTVPVLQETMQLESSHKKELEKNSQAIDELNKYLSGSAEFHKDINKKTEQLNHVIEKVPIIEKKIDVINEKLSSKVKWTERIVFATAIIAIIFLLYIFFKQQHWITFINSEKVKTENCQRNTVDNSEKSLNLRFGEIKN